MWPRAGVNAPFPEKQHVRAQQIVQLCSCILCFHIEASSSGELLPCEEVSVQVKALAIGDAKPFVLQIAIIIMF